MPKRIISIGYVIPGHDDSCHDLLSSQSLLDAEIIIFSPDIDFAPTESHNGKELYSQSRSFQLKEAMVRWKRELLAALEDGKTVFLLLRPKQDFFVYTGQSSLSGTGRSQRTINSVGDYDNYRFLPIQLPTLLNSKGRETVLTNEPIFADLFREFKGSIGYEVYMDSPWGKPLLKTKTGQKSVAAFDKVGNGHLIVLPAMEYDEDEFSEDANNWNDAGIQFGARFVNAVVQIDKALTTSDETLPMPEWARDETYTLSREKDVEKEISKISDAIEAKLEKKATLDGKLQELQSLKQLVYGKGKGLEAAVTEALTVLGYQAENYTEGDLEIDQVILSPEGNRYVGEVEGKDKTHISIDKFRQLESNIGEDLQRDEVSEPARGILFGNGFRLEKPDTRPCQFTDKCLKNAERTQAILIQTSDLFTATKNCLEGGGKSYAKQCRDAIAQSQGNIVVFPKYETPINEIALEDTGKA